MLLTIEIANPKELNQGMAEIEIYCDSEGLDSLIKQLNFLKNNNESHVHLMTKSWAGTELSEKVQGKGNLLIHKMTIAKPK
ncbi:MAG: Imm32 family immunity protein [Bdellovibrionota bacterium]